MADFPLSQLNIVWFDVGQGLMVAVALLQSRL